MAVGVNWRALMPSTEGCCAQGGEEGEGEESDFGGDGWVVGKQGNDLCGSRLVLYLEARQREMSMEQFEELLDSLEVFLRSLTEGGSLQEVKGTIFTMKSLLQVKKVVGDDFVRKLVIIMKDVIRAPQKKNPDIVRHVADAFGQIVASGDPVEDQVRWAVRVIEEQKPNTDNPGMILVLKSLAKNAPASFNVYINSFISHIWKGLIGKDLQLRLISSEAFRACLRMFETRETRNGALWYHKLGTEAVRGLASPQTPVWQLHGYVIALSELLCSSGEFMVARYSSIASCALALMEHDFNLRESVCAPNLVYTAVLSLIPKLANYHPERFFHEHGSISLKYLTDALHERNLWGLTIEERNRVFYALSETIIALCDYHHMDLLETWEKSTYDVVSSAILTKAQGADAPFQGAFKCCGVLAEALGPKWIQEARDLLLPMAATGISDVLAEAMIKISESIPELGPDVKERILDAVTVALTDASEPNNEVAVGLSPSLDEQGFHEVKAQRLSALKVLGSFDFGDHNLLEFVSSHVVPLMRSSPELSLRQAAAKACVIFVSRHILENKSSSEGKSEGFVQKIVLALLDLAVTDPSEQVRITILQLLHDEQSVLGGTLQQPSYLFHLFTSFGDRCWKVVKIAFQLVGKLGVQSPGSETARPMLETVLDQLLVQLEICPGDEFKEECAKKLGLLVQSAPYVILKNTDRVCNQIIKLLKAEVPPGLAPPVGQDQPINKASKTGNTYGLGAVATAVLETLGHLAETAASQLVEKGYMQEMLQLTVQVLRLKCSQDKLNEATEAVKTLCKIVESTGNVIKPYQDFPWLLPELLKMLEVENIAIRKLVVKVLGTICALDPATFRVIQATASGEGQLEREGVRPVRRGETVVSSSLDRPRMCMWGGGRSLDSGLVELTPVTGISANSEESYSIIAMNTLLRILRTPAFSGYHRKAVGTLGMIARSLSIASIPFLQTLIPNWCNAIYSGDVDLRVYILDQFIHIVGVAKQHMRKFLDRIMQMLSHLWSDDCPKKTLISVLRLVGELAGICCWSFRKYLDWLVPRFVVVLDTSEDDVLVVALPALTALGFSLKAQFHQVLPSLCNLMCRSGGQGQGGQRINALRAVLKTIRTLVRQLHVSETTAVLVKPIISLMKRKALRQDLLETLASIVMDLSPDSMVVSYIKAVLASTGMADERINKVLSQLNELETLSSQKWEKGADWRNEFEPALPPLVEESGGGGMSQRLHLNERELRKAWNTAHVSNFDDWAHWMRTLSLSLLEASPSPAIRACYDFAHKIPGLAKDLFSASFISCWSELREEDQQQLIISLEAALASPRIPNEIITTLLNLAEFMEHDNLKMPLDTRTLAALALKCQALAKALHYKELEFLENPTTAVEAIISINNQLRQPEAADGMLKYAKKELGMEVKESWYEKLHKWERALHQYKVRASHERPGTLDYIDANMGCIRCSFALWDWDSLSKLCQKEWGMSDPIFKKEIGPLAAEASWHMGHWNEMSEYLTKPNSSKDTPDATRTAFLNAVLAIHDKNYPYALSMVDEARGHLSGDLAVLAGESYDRAYENMVMAQQLTEVEEAIQYVIAREHGQQERQDRILSTWRTRLQGVQQQAEVWQSLLSVRFLALQHHEDKGTWLKFASMCRQQNREHHAENTLKTLLKFDPLTRQKGEPGYGSGSGQPDVMYAFLKHVYYIGDSESRKEVYDRLKDLVEGDLEGGTQQCVENSKMIIGSGPLISKAYIRLGKWMQQQEELTVHTQNAIMTIMDNATLHAGKWAKAWREWALFHLVMMSKYESINEAIAVQHVAPAVRGFFQALHLSQEHALNGGMGGNGPSKDTYQDILRLLTLWFQHGNGPHVCEELEKGFDMVRVETWLVVLPQINARIHIKDSHIQRLIHMLLTRIGQAHPQALLYPLLVGSHSNSIERKLATEKVLHSMEVHVPKLVEEARLLTQQLVEIAVLLDERWHEALEEASRLYFAEAAPRAMLEVMLPLHNKLRDEPARTTIERNFKSQHGEQLDEAHRMLRNYETTNQETSTQCAWDNYYHVFKKINRDLLNMNMLHLTDVAPELLDREFMCAVPGTYAPFQDEQVCIQRIIPEIQVIKSKQRPRKLTIEGSDGHDYVFLLKGHEDLRQDERVMQLFGLVNTLMASDYKACERELSIARYAVIPLSPNVGLIGWVPNCDTMHQLIRDYRESTNIAINLEHQLMKSFAPNYDNLQLIQKIEVFEHALDSTEGDDLRKVMWIKSPASESWLAHRTCYIRSCAVMSIVGYILGLGDRHPSNLMIDRYTGKLLHIDFGDCFESGMNREKFPEKVPFRLTRMMVKAMEVSGVEGTYRQTCELVMRVLRMEKDRVMAMLEAFIYDPLINWRLVTDTVGGNNGAQDPGHEQEQGQGLSPSSLYLQAHESDPVPHPALSMRLDPLGGAAEEGEGLDVEMGLESHDLQKIRSEKDSGQGEAHAEGHEETSVEGGAHEMLNNRAIEVTSRIKSKLSGREFSTQESVSVEEQVDRLILEARSHANLCQAYIGWCPFW